MRNRPRLFNGHIHLTGRQSQRQLVSNMCTPGQAQGGELNLNRFTRNFTYIAFVLKHPKTHDRIYKINSPKTFFLPLLEPYAHTHARTHTHTHTHLHHHYHYHHCLGQRHTSCVSWSLPFHAAPVFERREGREERRERGEKGEERGERRGERDGLIEVNVLHYSVKDGRSILYTSSIVALILLSSAFHCVAGITINPLYIHAVYSGKPKYVLLSFESSSVRCGVWWWCGMCVCVCVCVRACV